MNLTEAQKAIETILAEVYKCGYEEGRCKGYKNRCIEEEFQNTNKYEDGLNEAWEAAKKIVCTEGYKWTELENMFNSRTLSKIFNTYTASEAIEKIKEYEEKQKEPPFKVGDRVRTLVDKDSMGVELFPVGTIGEVAEVDGNAIAVNADGAIWYYYADALELADDVVLVGDEVIYDREKCIVTAIANGGYTVMLLGLGGGYMVRTTRDEIQGKKTGQHFPQMVEILKQLQENNEND